ncbi:MAG: type II secretion system inner membrane protein GspF [Xanthomonadales bacterium]|nr:type II secretion system inner membrane protein GspF [Xanthomonadales bacterium]
MAAFEYQALTKDGRSTKGVREGDSARQVRQALREAGLIPLSVDPVHSTEKSAQKISFRRGFSTADLALIVRQLASLLKAGLPLAEALGTLAGQDTGRESKVLAGVRSRVVEGVAFAEALREFPQYFPEMVAALVAAGERSGRLDQVLARLADHLEEREQLGRDVGMSLLYPVVLVVVAIIVVGGLVTYVVPRVVDVFARLDQALPLATQILIATSDFLRSYGLWLLGLLVIAVIFAVQLLRNERYKRPWDRWRLALPVLGRLIKAQETSQLSRTLAILLQSAVPLVEALQVTRRVLGTIPFQDGMQQAARQVREGVSLQRSLADTRLVPDITLRLVASGERSGELPGMLEQAAEIHERELATAMGLVSGLLQPVLILFVGAMVLFIVLAILLPILDLNLLVS